MTGRDLIDRYVHEVGRSLPRGPRADLQAELHSLLQDALEEAARDSGARVEDLDADRVAEILREFGAPAEIARRYEPARYLIGPSLYPEFRTMLVVVIAVVTGLAAFGLLASLLFSREAMSWSRIAGLWSGWIDGVLMSGGMAVLIFALLERFGRADARKPTEEWDPRGLPAVDDPDRASRTVLILGIAWRGLVVVILVASFLAAAGKGAVLGVERFLLPFLAPGFPDLFPWLAALLVAEGLLLSSVRSRGRWTKTTRWIELILNLAGIAILLAILRGRDITGVPAADVGIKAILAIVVLIALFESAGQLWRLLTAPPGSAWRPRARAASGR